MRTTRRLLVLAVVLALPLAMMATASGAPKEVNCDNKPNHPDCRGGGEDPPERALNCEALGWANFIDPEPQNNNTLIISRADGDDCEDIPAVENGKMFTFRFTVSQPNPENTGWQLGIRNSVPGDWCGGTWSYYSGDPIEDNLLFSGVGDTGVRFPANHGYTLTLVVDEPRVDEPRVDDPEVEGDEDNCTTGGEVTWADTDAGSWVITLHRAGRGKKYKGDYSIKVEWTVTDP